MLLDTGSTTHVIAEWLARELRLEVKESHVDETTDHEGRRVPVYRTDNVQVSIEGWGSLFQSAFLVSALPAPF
jgi:Aspartyl protease